MTINFEDFKQKFQKKEVTEYPNQANEIPVVSVLVMTYQHSKFIKECLDGILIQQTTFPFEILLGEDDSTDGTREICIEYAEKYPDKIRLFLHHRENNIKINGSPTGRFNFLYNLYSAQGKYIALCEGDDYWTDPLKLQKQVDFLEANPDYALCCHNALIVDNRSNKTKKLKKYYAQSPEDTITLTDLIIGEGVGYIPTASTVFRANTISNIPSFFCELLIGDYALYLLASCSGNIKFINQVMSAYRVNDKSLLSTLAKRPKSYLWNTHVNFWRLFADSGILGNQNIVEEKVIFTSQKAIFLSLEENQFDIFLQQASFLSKRYKLYGVLILLQSSSLFLRNICLAPFVRLRVKLGLGSRLRKLLQ